jgi:hypothetical protein
MAVAQRHRIMRKTGGWIDHLPNGMFTSANNVSYAGWLQDRGMFSMLVASICHFRTCLSFGKYEAVFVSFPAGMKNTSMV